MYRRHGLVEERNDKIMTYYRPIYSFRQVNNYGLLAKYGRSGVLCRAVPFRIPFMADLCRYQHMCVKSVIYRAWFKEDSKRY